MKQYQYTCGGCKQEYTSDEFRVICPSCVQHAGSRMTKEQYRDWLIHNRSRIWQGLPLVFWDDTAIGDKDTYTSWGVCSDDLAAFPDPDTWAYGSSTEPNPWDTSRIRTIALPDKTHCPFDRRAVGDFSGTNPVNGCFYSCRIFSREVGKDNRAEALHWFDEAIKQVRG